MWAGMQPCSARVRETGALQRLPVDIGAVVNVHDVNTHCLLVYAVQQSAGPAPSAEGSGQLALKALVDPE